MKPLILFDFDGTIADSLDELIKSINSVGKKRGFHTKLTRKMARSEPIQRVLGALGIRFWKVPGMYKEVIEHFEARLSLVHPHQHMHKLLRSLAPHADFGIVSSNNAEIVREFLVSHKLIKYFPTIHGGSLFGKHRAIKKIVSSLRPTATLYVGDEVRDVLAAKRARVHSLAVTWGLQEVDVLLKARPSMIATTADEAQELMLAWVQSRV